MVDKDGLVKNSEERTVPSHSVGVNVHAALGGT